MGHALTGTLDGNVIILDDPGPVILTESPPRGQQRVRVILEPVLAPEEQERLVREWAEHGPQGPIED